LPNKYELSQDASNSKSKKKRRESILKKELCNFFILIFLVNEMVSGNRVDPANSLNSV
jgi:hypothetical protein